MISLNYMGIIPVHSPFDIVSMTRDEAAILKTEPGVKVLYPPVGIETDASFRFLRRMVLTQDHLILNYGPTCGIFSIHREHGTMRRMIIPGLIRDMEMSPDGKYLWAINWERADFLVIKPETLHVRCSIDLFDLKLSTPHEFLVDGENIYICNVTYPIVAQASLATTGERCSLTLKKSINFWKAEYTKFTDGAFSLHLDRQRNRLYAIVGMLEGKYLLGFVELDLDSFEILRDVRLPLGTVIQPIKERGTVLLPSYYKGEIYEVSLDEMKLLRTIKAEPNILSLAYDENRGLCYGLSRATGYFLVIEYSSGEVIRKIVIGPKPEPMWFDQASDQLYIGSGLGIFQIDLKEFLGEVKTAWDTPFPLLPF